MVDILFIVKDRNMNTDKKQVSGLIIASQHNVKYLKSIGVTAEAITVPDGNFLDSVIKQHHPRIVIIETVWIQPEKFKTLVAANPFVEEFVIRIHSDMAYFAIEGMGLDWSFKSQKISPKIKIAANCRNLYEGINPALPNKFIYLPNLYEGVLSRNKKEQKKNEINIGIFGAIRMLKNHAVQAIAAIKAAEDMGKILKLYINDLINDAGHNILSNIRQIFGENGKHKLIVQKWKSGQEYFNLIKLMDLGMQVSFTESFNIVAADFIVNGVPIVVGKTVSWVPEEYKTSYTDINLIAEKIKQVYGFRNNAVMVNTAYKMLQAHNNQAKDVWDKYIMEKSKI